MFCILHLYMNYTLQYANNGFFCVWDLCLNLLFFLFYYIFQTFIQK